MKYVSLHHHSTFSYMDGFGTPAQHVDRAVEVGMEAIAHTEHGNVSSHVQLEKAALKAGVKPIFGCELYTAPADMRETQNMSKWHLTVLAENQEGYINLMRLVTRSWAEGFYRFPTVSGAMLAEHRAGLIVLSGCSDSLVACSLLGGKGQKTHGYEGADEPDVGPDWEAAIRTVRRFKSIFGDSYYLEVQAFPELERTRQINSIYTELSAACKVPLVATSDIHYPRPDDNEMQKILHAAGRNTGTVAAAEAEWEYGIRLTFPLSDSALYDKLCGTGLSGHAARNAISVAAEIGQRCEVTLPKAELLRFPLAPGQTNTELTWEWLRRGWKYRWPKNPHMRAHVQDYKRRLLYEMDILQTKDFLDYFLMLSDVVRFAKNSGIPVGPARGSAAASLVCYLLRITEIDPLQFPTMMFERFVDTSRPDLPDVDLDFADDRRDEIRQYLEGKYGADHVGNLGSFTRYRGKNSVDDVARVYLIPKIEAETVKNLIVERSGGDARFDASLEDTREMFPKAKAVFDHYPDLNNALRLEGNYRGMGVHAAGLVVSNKPTNDVTATYTRSIGGDKKRVVSVLATDKKDAEYLGMLKVDFLGLTTMGMISICLELIGMKLEDLYAVPLDDPETLAAFKKGDVIGVFQFEGRATRVVNNDVSPDTFMHLADINALSRPGPLFSGATHEYIEVKRGRKQPEHLHPIVDKHTESSSYQIVYQEQVLAVLRDLGGFEVNALMKIRRIISQKMGQQPFNELYEQFINGAKRLHNVDAKLADRIWKLMITSATYSFNVAHAVSYSMIAFWCMWLKQHYPAEFYTAQLRKNDEPYHVQRLIKDAGRHGVEVLGPDLHVSGISWTVKGRQVRAGFIQVPGIGEKNANLIIADREQAPFADWQDLRRIKGIGPKKVELIQQFANDRDPFNVTRAERVLSRVRAACKEEHKHDPFQLVPTHTSDQIPADLVDTTIVWVGFTRSINYQDYVEKTRSRTGEATEDILRNMRHKDKLTSAVLRCYDDGEEDVYLRFHRLKFPKFKKLLESLHFGQDIVIAQGTQKRGSFGISIHVNRMQVIDLDELYGAPTARPA